MRRFHRAAALRLATLVGVCWLAGAHSTWSLADESDNTRGLLSELARMQVPRTTAPRLSVASAYRPCRALGSLELVPRTDCGRSAEWAGARAFDEFAGRAAGVPDGTTDPDTLQAAALADLMWDQGAGEALRRSTRDLQTAARLSARPASVLGDEAAAHLVRAQETQDAEALFDALEAADSAVALEPRNPAALFNLALALDWLGLDGQALEAWEAYLRVDPRSGWAGEARARVRALSASEPPARLPEDATPAQAAAFAARFPQEARTLGWERLLDQWGAAVLAGEPARAEDALRGASALGEALARRGGDATLADAVGAIRAADGEALRKLARAHRSYAAGQRAYLRLDHRAAERAFSEALREAPPSAALVGWVNTFRAASLYYLGKPDEAEGLARAVVARTDAERHPALTGRARWVLGTILLRSGRYEPSRDEYGEAARLFGRIGERENLGAVLYADGEAAFALGDRAAAHELLQRGLLSLRSYRRSRWLHGLLYVASRVATSKGQQRVAVRIHDEDVLVASVVGLPVYEAEARLARARTLAGAGKLRSAAVDVETSRAVIDRMTGDLAEARGWFEADLSLARATVLLDRRPDQAAPVLDTAVVFWSAMKNPIRLIPALVMRSEARLARGDVGSAMADLDVAVAMISELNTEVEKAALRVSMIGDTSELFNRLAMLHLSAGRVEQALAALERGRASFGTDGRVRPGGDAPPLAAPPGEVVVEPVLIGDTLLVWTVAGAEVRVARDTVDGAALLRTIEEVRTGLERGTEDARLRPALAALYDQLIRPVRDRLGPRLVLVADGEIAGAPLSALYDARRGRYLVQDHSLRFASSLRDALAPPPEAERTGRVVLVADPAFDPAANPGLERLAGAAEEADSVAVRYEAAVRLPGASATPAALRAALAGADVVHYAGHAVFDDARPEQSYLVLAPAGGRGRLYAAELDTLDLRHTRLVVLSACQTLRARSGRTGGFAGLSGALLGAGVGGVVGSLWRVDDRMTTPLMTAFHDTYRRTGDGAEALRQAQLRMLRSPDRASRSPAAWAGFRYAGR